MMYASLLTTTLLLASLQLPAAAETHPETVRCEDTVSSTESVRSPAPTALTESERLELATLDASAKHLEAHQGGEVMDSTKWILGGIGVIILYLLFM